MKKLLFRGEEFDPNFKYFSGVDIDHSFYIEEAKERILLTSKMNSAIAKESFDGKVVEYQKPFEELSKIIGKGEEVQSDLSAMSANLYKKIEKETGAKLIDASEEFLEKRSLKREDEVSKTKKAVKITKEIFEALDFKTAKTEEDLIKQIKIQTAQRGLDSAFEPIVGSGANSSFPHYHGKEGKIWESGFVLIDYGVKYEGYCADLTRCFIIKPNKKLEKEYEKLKGVFDSIIDKIPNFEIGSEIGKCAEEEIKKAGFPQLIHSIGHGVGLQIHEYPSLGLKSEHKIKNTLMAIEPAFYYTGKYGMRYEETTYFDGKKIRVL